MTLYYLPLEPIKTRYTWEWTWQFREVFKQLKLDYRYIEGETIQSNLNSKFFLDPINTNIWKLTQLVKLLKCNLKDDDIVFISDFWFPGIEVLPYIKHLLNKKFKIVGIAHAGTYDNWDLTSQVGMNYFGSHLEEAWFSIFDKIFVGTNYHKELILKNRIVNPDKIIVTGLPVDIKGLQKYKKLKRNKEIIFTGRKSIEKGYDFIKFLQEELLPIKVALDMNLNKIDYYKLLGKSKIVFAPSRQETFGYGIIEGMALDCIPIVPNNLSFREIVPDKLRYNNNIEAVQLLKYYLDAPKVNMVQFVEQYQYDIVIKEMIKNVS